MVLRVLVAEDNLLVETPVQSRLGQSASPIDRLSPREREVLEEMAPGRNNAGAIACVRKEDYGPALVEDPWRRHRG